MNTASLTLTPPADFGFAATVDSYAWERCALKDALTPFRRTWFRAGHVHAGVLLMVLLFLDFASVPCKLTVVEGAHHFSGVVAGGAPGPIFANRQLDTFGRGLESL